MQHSFSHFLRHGGDGQYEITQRHGHLIGRCVGVSLKSTFPNYTALRADFSERLEQVNSENTRMLLNALTPPDTVPTVSEAELRDVSDAKAEALNAWDARLAHIFGEYQNHPQRLRPLRTAMEERLLRAFAGLINQLRQETLGIEQYIWRSQDDAKVRDSHAAYDNRMFRWDEPPEGGHPGEAHNCRCYAEPISPAVSNNVVFADFAPTADSFPNGNNTVRRLSNGLLAARPQVWQHTRPLKPVTSCKTSHARQTKGGCGMRQKSWVLIWALLRGCCPLKPVLWLRNLLRMVSYRTPRNAGIGQDLLPKPLAFMKWSGQGCSRYQTTMPLGR